MTEERADPPLCGDPTCEGPGCRRSAIDAYYARRDAEVRALVDHVLHGGVFGVHVVRDGVRE